MKERRETLCRLVQIPRQKVKTPPKTYPRRIFKEARDAGGGVFLADPPPIWEGESAMHTDENRAAGQKYTDLRRCSAKESQKDEHQSSGRSRWTLM